MKKVLKVLIIAAVVLLIGNVAFLGVLLYRNTHFFVEKSAYSLKAQELDLREKEITVDHYLAVREQLPDCVIHWNVPFQGGTVDSDSESLAIADLDWQDIDVINSFLPSLKTVDASNCNNYEMLEALKEQLPDLDVRYTVSLGTTQAEPDAAQLTLTEGSYVFDTLLENLKHLPQVQQIQLPKTAMTLDQLHTLQETYPEVEFAASVEILGNEYDMESTELNLSGITEAQIPEVREKLGMLPNLEYIELMADDGSCGLPKEAVKELISTTNASVHFSFDFYGVTISSDDEEVILKNKKIGDEGEEEIRLALDLMTNCRRFVLDNCKVSNDVMAQIREDYRDRTKVVWRVYFGVGSTLTDAEVIRAVYDLVDDNCGNLKYCEDVRFMDIGHDEYLDAVPFIAYMPNLEVVIVSGSPIKDLSPFTVCKKLRVLELSDCGYIQDLTPLAECESLEMLNICYTKVKDLSGLENLKLTHLIAKQRYKILIPKEEQERFIEQHPDCLVQFSKDDQPYGIGWRYIEKNKPMEWYAEIREIFRYTSDPPNHVGWYLKK